MRELRFRAWDKGANGMHPPMTIQEIGTILRQQQSETMAAVAFKFAFDSLIWSMDTGLKIGKNPIFEGDIIEFELEDETTETGVVRFSDGGYWTSQTEGHSE